MIMGYFSDTPIVAYRANQRTQSTRQGIMKARILTVGLDGPLVESRAANALEKLRSEQYDLLLGCLSTPHEQGTALIHEAREEFPTLRIVRLLLNDSPHIAKPVADTLVTVDYRPQT
jgi:DNA-binding NarL/FixJ family response regulator